MANTCANAPIIGNKTSKMYKEMLERIGNRPLVNWLYCLYESSNAHDVMIQATNPNGTLKYHENDQGEFKATELLDFLDYSTMMSEVSSLTSEEIFWGIVDNTTGQRVEFTDAETALRKADDFNNHHKGLVAGVYKYGNNKYRIIASEKNTRTHMHAFDVDRRLKLWDMYKAEFNTVGIDLDALPADAKASIFNPYNVDIAQSVRNLQNSQFDWLYYEGALALLSMDPNAAPVQRFINMMGSIENAAHAIENMNKGIGTFTSHQVSLAKKAIAEAQKVRGLDLAAIQAQAAQMSQNLATTSPEMQLRNTLNKLNRKYNIDINEINLMGDRIDTLSRAAGEAVIQLDRRIRELEKLKGNAAEGKRLEGILNQLLLEVNNKKYYNGLLRYLKEGLNAMTVVQGMLSTPPNGTTELEKAFDRAKTLYDVKAFHDQYYNIVKALAAGNITIDESIGQTDIDVLVDNAKQILEFFDSEKNVLDKLAEETMINILRQTIGDTAPNGQDLANVVKMAQVDSSIWDYLYSMGRASNPVIGAMGAIVLGAKEARDGVMNKISRRIRGEEAKLRKNGSNSEFMYIDEEHVLSDIDWPAYMDAKAQAAKQFGRQGLSGWDFKMAMENWEESQTEDRVVDKNNGRTERVPNKSYRLNNGLVWDDVNHTMTFTSASTLTKAQQDYYNAMMEIKGELGSYLPPYAQMQYRSPQIRRNMVDAIAKAKSAGDVLKALKNKGQNIYKVREDDTNYASNGFSRKSVIDGEEYVKTEGGYDNTAFRNIPIYFMNKVEEGELLKDFSTGLQHLAGTAINYDAVSSVAQVVEFMGDFAKKHIKARDKVDRRDVVGNKFVQEIKQLEKWGRNTLTENMIEGFMMALLYDVKRSPNENKELSKLVDNLVYYTSFKGLSTNLPGALANYLVGEFQMMIEAGAGEFYGISNYLWAHTKLFGSSGVTGEIWDMVTGNMNSKSGLLGEMFDPIQENFTDKMGKRYHQSLFRRIMANDISFLGYGAGEYLIHYVNMYAVLDHEKVFMNGKKISLYDAFIVKKDNDSNSHLEIKPGVTIGENVNGKWVDTGRAIDEEYLRQIRNRVRKVNHSTHGAMNQEDKGLIHRYMLGRMAMNFRQWMVEHYSRRFRKRHFDYTMEGEREGYWYSVGQGFIKGKAGEAWNDKQRLKAMGYFMRDLVLFMLRQQAQWEHLDEMQRYNVKRANSEILLWVALCGLSMAFGEPDEHKKEFWRRWWIYQVKRMILETEASMPHPQMPKNALTILQSPMASITVLNSMLYCIYGIGDITEEIKSGPHKGENRYWRTIKKNTLPFIKDIERIQNMDTSDAVFMPFTNNNPNR